MAAAEQKSAQMEARAVAIERLVDEGLLEVPGAAAVIHAENLPITNGDMDIESQLEAMKQDLFP